jgi:hypothetical protein
MREAELQRDETYEEQLQALADRAAELEAEARTHGRGDERIEPEEVYLPDLADQEEPLYVVPAAASAEPAAEAEPAPEPEEPAPSSEAPAAMAPSLPDEAPDPAQPEPGPEFVPSEPGLELVPDPAGDPYPTLQALEQRVQAAQERIYEWRYYLNLLRRHADENGVLPAHFERLIEDVFFSEKGPGRRD